MDFALSTVLDIRGPFIPLDELESLIDKFGEGDPLYEYAAGVAAGRRTNEDMPMEKDSSLTIRIPSDLKRSAEIVAELRDESLSQVIRRMLREYVKANQQGDLFTGKKGVKK